MRFDITDCIFVCNEHNLYNGHNLSSIIACSFSDISQYPVLPYRPRFKASGLIRRTMSFDSYETKEWMAIL